MKSPSQNVSKSLRGQRIAARAPYMPEKSMPGGSPSMIAPGDGMVEKAPGADRDDRSAVKAADAMENWGKFK